MAEQRRVRAPAGAKHCGADQGENLILWLAGIGRLGIVQHGVKVFDRDPGVSFILAFVAWGFDRADLPLCGDKCLPEEQSAPLRLKLVPIEEPAGLARGISRLVVPMEPGRRQW